MNQKRLYRKLKIKQDTPKEEINKRILDFARGPHRNLREIYKSLKDEQICDNELIVGLVRVQYDKLLDWYALKNLLGAFRGVGCGACIRDTEFIYILEKEFPDECMLKALADVITDDSNFDEVEGEKAIDDVAIHLPDDFILSQAKKFGLLLDIKKIICRHPHVEKLVEQLIEYYGFEAVTLLPSDKILANKNLIIKAAKQDGNLKLGPLNLYKYINSYLNPHRIGPIILPNYINEDREKVQSALAEDEEILQTFVDLIGCDNEEDVLPTFINLIGCDITQPKILEKIKQIGAQTAKPEQKIALPSGENLSRQQEEELE